MGRARDGRGYDLRWTGRSGAGAGSFDRRGRRARAMGGSPRAVRIRCAKRFAALWRASPIPVETIDAVIRSKERKAVIAWVVHGIENDIICIDLTGQETETIA